MLAPDPPHPDPERGDLLLSPNKRGEGSLGTAGFALGTKTGRGQIRQPLAQIGEALIKVTAGDHLLKLTERPLHQQVDVLGFVKAEQVEGHVVGGRTAR